MKKVFLYLYPIKEFTSIFLFHNDKIDNLINICYIKVAFEREIKMLSNQITTTTNNTTLKSISYIGCFSIA